jgi:predicted porin
LLSFGVSFADATLFGWVDQSHNTVTTTAKTTGTKTTTQSWGASQGGTSALGVKGDEDLGDGLKASYLMELGIDADVDTANGKNRQSYVGLDGAFGGIKIGRQYTPSFNAMAAMDPSGVSGYNGFLWLNGMQLSNGFYYTSPSLSGFNLILGMHEGEVAESSQNNATTFGLTYSGGPLYASFTQETTTKGTTTVGLNGTADGETSRIGNSYANSKSGSATASSLNGENKLQTLAATYDLGVAKIGVMNETIDSTTTNGGEAKATHFSLAVPVGSFTLGAVVGNGSYTVNTASAASVDMTSVGITADYAMSKRTKVYFRFGEINDKVTTSGLIEKSSTTVIGLFHSF